jgi:hypothetical protein
MSIESLSVLSFVSSVPGSSSACDSRCLINWRICDRIVLACMCLFVWSDRRCSGPVCTRLVLSTPLMLPFYSRSSRILARRSTGRSPRTSCRRTPCVSRQSRSAAGAARRAICLAQFINARSDVTRHCL